MPTVKHAKSPKQHPPCNRAFALRMMHPTQYVEGRISPLDRALKPIKESFKRASKSKRKEKTNSQNSNNTDMSGGGINMEDIDSSYEISSPSDEVDIERDFVRANSIRSEPGKLQEQQYSMNPEITKKSSKYDNRSHRIRTCDGNVIDVSSAGMENIDEEDEIDACNETNNETPPYFDVYRQVKYNTSHSYLNDAFDYPCHLDKNTEKSLKTNQALTEESEKSEKAFVENSKQSESNIIDQDVMFVTSNGDVVKLRKKNSKVDRTKADSSAAEDKRTQRFGKRLSLLCHMLAEKYPEDFHILELLVDLQVSNEKREKEINECVLNLERKVDSMEVRLRSVEQLSLPGLQQVLFPLANAAASFYKGLKKSIDTAQLIYADGGICDDDSNSKSDGTETITDHKNHRSSGHNNDKKHETVLNTTENLTVDEKVLVDGQYSKEECVDTGKTPFEVQMFTGWSDNIKQENINIENATNEYEMSDAQVKDNNITVIKNEEHVPCQQETDVGSHLEEGESEAAHDGVCETEINMDDLISDCIGNDMKGTNSNLDIYVENHERKIDGAEELPSNAASLENEAVLKNDLDGDIVPESSFSAIEGSYNNILTIHNVEPEQGSDSCKNFDKKPQMGNETSV